MLLNKVYGKIYLSDIAVWLCAILIFSPVHMFVYQEYIHFVPLLYVAVFFLIFLCGQRDRLKIYRADIFVVSILIYLAAKAVFSVGSTNSIYIISDTANLSVMLLAFIVFRDESGYRFIEKLVNSNAVYWSLLVLFIYRLLAAKYGWVGVTTAGVGRTLAEAVVVPRVHNPLIETFVLCVMILLRFYYKFQMKHEILFYLALMTVLMSWSRGSWLVVVFFTIFVFFLSNAKIKRTMLMQGVVIALFVVLISIIGGMLYGPEVNLLDLALSRVLYSVEQFQGGGHDIQYKRLYEILAAAEMLGRNQSWLSWLFGLGPGAEYLGPVGMRVGEGDLYEMKHYMHNMPFFVTFQYGLLGLTAYLLFFAVIIKSSLSLMKNSALKGYKVLSIFTISMLVGQFLCALFDPLLLAFPIAPIMGFVFAITYRLNKNVRNERRLNNCSQFQYMQSHT